MVKISKYYNILRFIVLFLIFLTISLKIKFYGIFYIIFNSLLGVITLAYFSNEIIKYYWTEKNGKKR